MPPASLTLKNTQHGGGPGGCLADLPTSVSPCSSALATLAPSVLQAPQALAPVVRAAPDPGDRGRCFKMVHFTNHQAGLRAGV